VKQNTKAILITPNGCCRPVLVSGNQQIYTYIGCEYFDVVRIGDGADIFVDDVGLITERPLNMVASLIATQKTRQPYQLYGPVLIFGHTDDGESVDCPRWVYDALKSLEPQPKKEEADAKSA